MTEDPWVSLVSAQDLPTLRRLLSDLPHGIVLQIAGKAFHEVICANFAGGRVSSPLPSFLSTEFAVSELKFDLNEPYLNVRALPLLLLAKIAVLDQNQLMDTNPRARLLAFRILLLWQKILREPCAILKDLMDEYAQRIELDLLEKEERMQYFLERANALLSYYEYEKCSDYIQRALEISGLNLELAGKMGKRTRFQQHDIAQLVLNAIIRQRRCWSVQAAALLVRCELERTRNRRVERACAQSELICKLMDGVDDETPETVKMMRTDLMLASGLEPFWNAHVIHAETLRSLGCTAISIILQPTEALLIYEKLQMWDSVIDCFKQLGQLEKAEALIRKLLLERPNDSMLYCYLGDITMETSYYDKAIEISNDHNARARKSFGFLMLLRNQFDSAYEHLRRSLELQPIQEALKFNYEHPKVWENYLLLCVDTAQFEQAIKAFHRLLDLNKQQKDDEVLEIIARNVLRICDDADDEQSTADAATLKADLVKLFGRVSAVQSLSSKAWKAYASLKRPKDGNVEEAEKYIQLLERALLADSNKPNWSKDLELCCSVLSSAIELATERLRVGSVKGGDAIKQAKSRVRMSLKPLMTIAKKECSGQDPQNNEEKMVKVKELLEEADKLLLEASQ
ncbi:tetratricopeptide repeat protein [Ancylostoma duodenale]|uniref:Tetratricopeptide repeat protein n=1 Tax=Ancylostoma duodenale TaxID=51022 RepID=A0A0C2GP54_9BILA|nr:tetratricopeptide repeat protein [Ancylostoma duodenale]